MKKKEQPAAAALSAKARIRIEKIYAAKIWIAEITGIDTKFDYARTFIGVWDSSLSNSKGTRGCFLEADLEEGKLYQICESKKSEYFCTAKDGVLITLTPEEVQAELDQRGAPVVETLEIEASKAEALADELELSKNIPESPLIRLAYTRIERQTEKALLCRINVPDELHSRDRVEDIWIPRSVLQEWDQTERRLSLPASYLATKGIYDRNLILDCINPHHFEIVRRLGGVKVEYGTWVMPSFEAWRQANWCIRRPLLAPTDGLSEAKLRRNGCTKSGTRWQAPNYATYAKLVNCRIQ